MGRLGDDGLVKPRRIPRRWGRLSVWSCRATFTAPFRLRYLFSGCALAGGMPCLRISLLCVDDLFNGRLSVGLLSGLTLQSSMLSRPESSCNGMSSKCDSFSVDPLSELSDR